MKNKIWKENLKQYVKILDYSIDRKIMKTVFWYYKLGHNAL